MINKDVSPGAYRQFREFLEQQCGIVLGDNKQYLVRSRLGGLLHERQLTNIDELLRQSISGRDRGLLQQVIDAMTTNETRFFREGASFEALKTVVMPASVLKHELGV